MLVARCVEHARALPGRTMRGVALATLELSLIATLLFYSHVSSFSIFVPTALLCALAVTQAPRPTPWGARLRAAMMSCAWAILPALAAIRFVLVGRLSARPGSGLDDGAPGVMSIGRSLHALPLWIFDNFRHRYDDGIALGYWVLYLSAAGYAAYRVFQGKHRVTLLQSIPLLVAGVVYVATPFRVGAATFLNVRLAPIVLLLSLVPLRPLPFRSFTRLVALVSLVGGLQFYVSSRMCEREDANGLAEVLAKVRQGSSVVSLNFERTSGTTYVAPYIYEGSIPAAEHGGSVSFYFASLPHWSIRYKEGAAPPRHRPFWVFSPCEFRNRVDGAFFDAVIVRGPVDPFATEPQGPVFTKVAEAGRYKLFQRDEARTFTGPDRGPCPSTWRREPRDETPYFQR
jgi:hypothetical protein